MLKAFKKFILDKTLCSSGNKILIALSGGVDSMVLVHLFTELNYNIGLAHCNFKLRGAESDLDEKLVENMAESKNLTLHKKDFDTINYAKENKLSIEMAARELRYTWFKQLLTEFDYQFIATGHHSNDSAETVFLNLCRGTGINGISGIPAKNNNIIRPLLFATREQIEKYAKENNLNYRYDSSNDSMKYMRNIIRHQVIPALRKINPAFDEVMVQNIECLNDSASLFNQYISDIKEKLIIKSSRGISISIAQLIKHTPLKTVLYEIIKDYNFNNAVSNDIIANISEQSGKLFYSSTHQLLIDRTFLFIEKIENKAEKIIKFHSLDELVESNYFKIAEIKKNTDTKIIKDNRFAYLDLDKIKFPLSIDVWNSGDSFQPLGMNQFKKVSDFLIDNKMSRFDKENIRILKSKKSIVWILGHRIDDRFKITDKTENVLILN